MIKIEQMTEANQSFFCEIWIPWLKVTTGAEPQVEDLQTMASPVAYYEETGGAAFIAYLDGKPVGVVAVKGLGAAGFEFCKLVVDPIARGHGIGPRLIEASIHFAREAGGSDLWLQSFNKLKPALKIYEAMGFEHSDPPEEMSVLQRTEVIMKMGL